MVPHTLVPAARRVRRLVVAAAHLEDVKGKIADLRQMERVETVASCEAGSGSHCALIDALYTDSKSGGLLATVKRSAARGGANHFVPENSRKAASV
jgi:hypothetical protein